VTEVATRRSTGTHYTPPSLTEPIVRHTLEPLVYAGPAEGLAKEQWKLKSPKEILGLKLCDMAMGSGAFLVQACRYLAERLAEAWENEEKAHPGQVLITPDGQFSEGSPSERLVPAEAAERVAIARRVVANHCLYGVDVNPMAVEMAKLSMWLITVDANRPFTFLDHAFKCGDSLLGVTSLEQLENFSMRPGGGKQQAFATLNLRRHIEEAKKKREALEEMPSDTPEQVAAKAALFAEAEAAVAKLHAAADVLVAVELRGAKGKVYEAERELAAEHMMAYWAQGLAELKDYSCERLGKRQAFHWALAFPEIVENGGFHSFVGNPPFLGGQKITGVLGIDYRDYIVQFLVDRRKGSADLSVFFLMRVTQMVHRQGSAGFVLSGAIAEGDNREVGLEHINEYGAYLYRADASKKWPGSATVTYSAVWIFKGKWYGEYILNNETVSGVTSYLTALGAGSGNPYRINGNNDKSFIGHYVLGMGFLMTPEQAMEIIDSDEKYADVLFPFLNGSELNATWNSAPTRWVINFKQWPLSKETAPQDYLGPVAEDYPLVLDIVRRLVKPERERNNRQRRKDRWWLYGDYAPSLELAIYSGKLLFAISMTAAKHIAFAPANRGVLLSHTLAILAFDKIGEFAVVSSSLHDHWVRLHTSYNLAIPRYIHTDCFLTFPFPVLSKELDEIGERYLQRRTEIMRSRKEGLTSIYNRVHELNEVGSDIAELRRIHTELDIKVAAAYGWQDIDLGHGFHKIKQGVRYTISEAARCELLDRLLALNHQRHTEEIAAAAAWPNSTSAKRGRKKKDSDLQAAMDF
jgi:hypothetical protein